MVEEGFVMVSVCLVGGRDFVEHNILPIERVLLRLHHKMDAFIASLLPLLSDLSLPFVL